MYLMVRMDLNVLQIPQLKYIGECPTTGEPLNLIKKMEIIRLVVTLEIIPKVCMLDNLVFMLGQE